MTADLRARGFYRTGVALLALAALCGAAGPAAAGGRLSIRPGAPFSPAEEAALDARLRADLDTLTFDHQRNVLRSRHYLRPETYIESVPFLERRARDLSALPPELTRNQGVASRQDAFRVSTALGTSIPLINLHVFSATYPAPGVPRVILCSHYDSDGSLSGPGWNADRDPAPGADDAGSGCVALLELARRVACLRLPFAVDCVFFGGEEPGLLGSSYEAAQARGRGDSILAVVNLDQLAYAPRGDSLFVVCDSSTAWLADSLVRVSARAWSGGPPLVPHIPRVLSNNSDHYPYTANGYPAVMLVESPFPGAANPTTETVADTLGNVHIPAIRRAVELVSQWLSELAEPVLQVDPIGWESSILCGAAARAQEGTALELPAVEARVLAGGAAAGSDLLVTTDVQEAPFLAGNSCTRRITPNGGLDLAEDSIHISPGSVIRLEGTTVRLERQRFGPQFLQQEWHWGPAAILDRPAGSWSALASVDNPDSASWDLGPLRNPWPIASLGAPCAVGVKLPLGVDVGVAVFDVAGRSLLAGTSRVGSIGSGYGVALLSPEQTRRMKSGVYFYRLQLADGRSSLGRLVLLR